MTDVNEPQLLKSLQTKRKLLKRDILVKGTIYTEAKVAYDKEHKEYHDLTAELREVEKNIKSFKQKVKDRKVPIVTEHAMLRYVEHVYGINLEDIQNNILTDRNVLAYKTLGNGRYPVGDIGSGCKAVIKNGSVVTVVNTKPNVDKKES